MRSAICTETRSKHAEANLKCIRPCVLAHIGRVDTYPGAKLGFSSRPPTKTPAQPVGHLGARIGIVPETTEHIVGVTYALGLQFLGLEHA